MRRIQRIYECEGGAANVTINASANTSAYSYYKHPLFFFPPPNSRARQLVSCSCETHRSARAADACSKTSQGLPSLDARVSKSASLKPIWGQRHTGGI